MSKYSLSKALRRKKRQAKETLKAIHRGEIHRFQLEQFFGIKDLGHMPSKDPDETNHRRVIRQRMESGRINVDGYKKAKGVVSEGPTS